MTSCNLVHQQQEAEEQATLSEMFNEKMKTVTSAELGTVECKVSKIIKADDKASWYKFGDRKILFECHGVIKAGIDLSAQNSYMAQIDEPTKSIVLTLPAAKILAINLPANETKLVYEKVSSTRFSFDAQERTALLKQGEASIREDIEKSEIKKEAEKNATSFFTAMLGNMGFEKITIKYQ